MIRSALRLAGAIVVSLVAGTWLVAGPAAQNPPASSKPQQQGPTFRSAANLVTVDAYPRRDGHIIEGLKPADFELLEDGVAQKIDQFEFVRVEPAPEVPRADPNNQRDMLQQVADPHNRVFVVYLDTYHVSVVGSHDIRRPLVEMLNRIIAPNDLFGVTTSKVNPQSLVLARKMLSIEEQLARNWPWGERKRISNDPDDPFEDYFQMNCRASDELRDRRREENTLENLYQLIDYVGSMREARTSVVVITDGWRLFLPDPTLNPQRPSALTPVGTTSSGQLVVNTGMNQYPSDQACAAEFARLAMLDDSQKFKDIIALANRKNVVFYPVNPAGLEMFDSDIVVGRTGNASNDAARPRRDPSDKRNDQLSDPTGMLADKDRHTARVDSAITLAKNTDGIAVVNTNDLREGLAKIVNDVSAYYLLGYYSMNAKPDGKYRQIKVRVKQDKVDVVARRGYVVAAPVANASRALGSGDVVAPADVTESRNALERIGTADLFTYGVVSGNDLVVVAEISSQDVELGKWRDGGTVNLVVTGASGESIATVNGKIEAGSRGVLMRVPFGITTGPWKVAVSVNGKDGDLDDRIDVRKAPLRLLADPILYRATGIARTAPLRPVADFLYRRTERVHVEWPIVKALDGRTARLLDRRGQPIPVEVTLTEREINGQNVLAADLGLSQLSPGDFVLEVSATSGAESQKRLVAVRVVR